METNTAKTVTLELTREELEHMHEALAYTKGKMLEVRNDGIWAKHQLNAMIRTKIERVYSGS